MLLMPLSLRWSPINCVYGHQSRYLVHTRETMSSFYHGQISQAVKRIFCRWTNSVVIACACKHTSVSLNGPKCTSSCRFWGRHNRSPYKVVAKQIVGQCLQTLRTMYQQEHLQYKDRQRLDKGRNKLNVADTVVKSWTTISQRCLFGILSHMVTNKPTSLQIALDIRVRQKNRVKS